MPNGTSVVAKENKRHHVGNSVFKLNGKSLRNPKLLSTGTS